MSNPHTIRINPIKEKDLHEFFQEKGFKNGVRFLYNFYKNNKDLENNIIERLKQEIDFNPRTTVKPKRIEEVATKQDFNYDDEADDMLGNFLK